MCLKMACTQSIVALKVIDAEHRRIHQSENIRLLELLLYREGLQIGERLQERMVDFSYILPVEKGIDLGQFPAAHNMS